MGLLQTEHFLLFLSQIQSALAGGARCRISCHYQWLVHCWVLMRRGGHWTLSRNRCFLASKGYMAGREREQEHRKLKQFPKVDNSGNTLFPLWSPKCWIWNSGHLLPRLFKHIHQGAKQVKQQLPNYLHSSNIQLKC